MTPPSSHAFHRWPSRRSSRAAGRSVTAPRLGLAVVAVAATLSAAAAGAPGPTTATVCPALAAEGIAPGTRQTALAITRSEPNTQRSTPDGHWAFQPVRPPRVPRVKDARWVRNPIDAFILAKLEENGLRPSPHADPVTLIRRVTFDLTGLPPTPEEIDAFLREWAGDEGTYRRDAETQSRPTRKVGPRGGSPRKRTHTPTPPYPHTSPQNRRDRAYKRLVDRLLASPAYGERWGRHWLDVARYADTAGDNADYPIPEARHYRDYVIDALNADKPYDDFVREQLAGDLLAARGPRERYAERVAATGFLALSRRYGTMPGELWHLTLEDTIDTTGRAFLGLTLRCARCHDHKYDPVTREDYYGLYGIFNSTRFPYAGSEEFQSKGLNRMGFVPLRPPGEVERTLRAHRERLAELEAQIVHLEKREPGAGDPARLPALKAELKALQRPGLPSELPAAYGVQEGTPADAALQVRGEPATPGAVVPRRPPAFLLAGRDFTIPPGTSGRRELADWIASPNNPLTARVMVNRVWQWHFGRGLVGTPSNFGLRGERPTHPGLLDWLAAVFVRTGSSHGVDGGTAGRRDGGKQSSTPTMNWSLKTLHRLIVLSAAYRQTAGSNAVAERTDPANRWLWRFNRQRLDAEALRDAMLAAAGTLDLRRPGDHPFPAIASWGFTQHNPFRAVYTSRCRSVYLMTQRIQRHPYLALFDGPDPNTTTESRGDSITPLQALYLRNDPFVGEQAAALARRVMASADADPDRIRLACRLAWGRAPSVAELRRAQRFLTDGRRALGGGEPDPEVAVWSAYGRVLLTSDEFLYVD
jgi:hypothetical protein